MIFLLLGSFNTTMALIASKATGNYLPGYSVEHITLTKDPSVNKHPARLGERVTNHMSHVSFISLHSNRIQLQAADCLTVITWKTT